MSGTRWARASLLAVLALCVSVAPAAAQSLVPTATISTANASCTASPTSCVIVSNLAGVPSIGVYINVGTSGTFNFEQLIEETPAEIWEPVTDDVNAASTLTADGSRFFSNPGYRKFRVRASAINGPATVRIERGFAGLRSTATLSGSAQGDGAIQDGASAAIRATVLDLATTNPMTVAITDATGNQITAFGGGVQFAEDAASNNADTGTLALARRTATPANTSGADLDYEVLQMNAGRLWVDASGVSLTVIDGGGSLTVDNGGTFAVQAAQSGTWNVTNVSGTVSLPTGASTAAKQPALGTAGAASADVLTIQGIASMTPLLAAQSGTWTASVSQGGLTATVRDTGASDSLNVAIVDGSGNQISSFGGGTQFAEDAASNNADVGTLALARRTATPANTSGADLDYEVLQMNAGRLWVDASGVTLTVGTHAVTGSGTFTVDSELAAAVALSDNISLPTVPIVGAAMLCYDGSNLDLCRSALTTEATHDGPLTVASTVSTVLMGRSSASAPANVSATDDAVLGWFLPNGSQVVNLAAGGTLITGTGSSVNVNCTGGCTSTSIADDSGFTFATTTVVPMGGVFDAVSPDSVDENDVGAIRMSGNRNLYTQIRDGAGNERSVNVTAGNALVVDNSGVTQPVSGTITANAGTGNFATNIAQVGGNTVVTAGLNGTIAAGGPIAFDGAASAISPLLMGCYASQAAPTDVSADNDATRLWCLRNGSPVTNLAAGGTLITATSSSLNTNVTGGTITTITNTVTVAGAKTNNNAAPGATNVGALTALANASAPSWTEGNLVALSVDLAGAQRITGAISCSNCTGTGASKVDDAAFTIATDSVAPAGFLFDDVASDSVNEGDVGLARMSGNRVAYTMLRDAAGNERGVNVNASNELQVNATGTVAVSSITTNIVPGTSATHLGKAIDSAAGATDTGVAALAVHDAVLTALTPVDGDYVPFRTNAFGAQWTIGDLCGSDAVQSVPISTNTSGNVQLVALSGSTVVYVCGWDVMAAGTVNVQLVYGTGSACGTGETDLTGTYQLTTQTGIARSNGGAVQTKTAAGNALCVELSGAVQIDGMVTYVQR